MPVSDSIIGIDLGTSNSVVAVLENEVPRVIPNAEGSTRTPSVVSFMESGEIFVGDLARRQGTIFPERTITATKRLMGLSLSEIDQHYLDFLPYSVAEQEGSAVVVVGEAVYTPAHIASQILGKLKSAAEDYLGGPVGRAIITVPAYFDDQQRQCVVEAAKEAGLDVVRLLNEPAAAAMAYGLGRSGHERVAVLDFGGGTFDMTILDISDNVFEVRCSIGDTQLGGDDIDEVIMRWIFEEFEKDHGFCLKPDPMALRRVKDASEKAKCELSVAMQAVIQLPFLTMNEGVPVHFEKVLRRGDFENLAKNLLLDLLRIVEQGLTEISLAPDEIDKIVLVGGSMRIPMLQQMVEDYFAKPPFRGLNPDEIVAMGAATQGGVLCGKLREVVLLDVTPHSLGIETEDGYVSHVIEKNSMIPTRASKIFTTTRDNQQVVQVHVLQGEGSKAGACKSLGNFVLDGIQQAQAGMARIEVSFSINANGMVEVSAVDLITREERTLALALSPGDCMPTAEGGSVETRRKAAAQRVAGMIPNAIPGNSETQSLRNRQILRANDQGEYQPTDTQVWARSLPDGTKRIRAHVRNPELTVSPLPAPPDATPTSTPVPPPVMAVPVEFSTSSYDLPAAHMSSSSLPKPEDSMDDRLRSALDALNRHATDPASINGYLQVIVHLRKLAVNSTTPELARSAVLMTCLLGQVHESSQLLGDLLKTPGVLSDTELLEFLNIHVQNFPGEYSTRVLRADLYIKMGKPKEAIADYEVVCDNPIVCKPAHVATLLDLYKQQLNASSSPEIKFRIVKLFLHSKRYDDAIALLQPMTRSSQLRERATKVLALCFWRKGMHYLAWQRLQELPTSEDVKDLLYRLAVDMQQSDQSINALAVFKFLADTDPHYKDVKNRLPVLEELVKNMSERRGPGLTQRPNAEYSPGKSGNSGGINPAFTRQSQGIMEALKDSRFTPLEEINRGSMGIVFRARDKVLDELVALKILSDYLAYDESAVERFKREARAAKRLSHPNIVRIHDMYEIGGKRLLSMEYIDGMDVKNILVRDRIMPIDQVISTARGVCHALEYAHQMGIVHRDIKPANIMVCPSGLVKVTDFGIAKFLNQQSLQDASGTQTMGTPLYMSPEQVRGDTVDYRTDIYSLGITLFEMLTGRPPFYEGNIEYHHLYSKPKAITREDIPAELTALTLKCLEKDPNNRFQTITEVRQALVNIQKIQ